MIALQLGRSSAKNGIGYPNLTFLSADESSIPRLQSGSNTFLRVQDLSLFIISYNPDILTCWIGM